MITVERARYLRRIIEQAAQFLDDETAGLACELFPKWDENGSYVIGDRVNYEGILYKCVQANTAHPAYTPLTAVSLWTRVLADPSLEPEEWVQPISTNAYMTGDRVKFEGHIYESLIDNNVWSPAVLPSAWLLIS